MDVHPDDTARVAELHAQLIEVVSQLAEKGWDEDDVRNVVEEVFEGNA